MHRVNGPAFTSHRTIGAIIQILCCRSSVFFPFCRIMTNVLYSIWTQSVAVIAHTHTIRVHRASVCALRTQIVLCDCFFSSTKIEIVFVFSLIPLSMPAVDDDEQVRAKWNTIACERDWGLKINDDSAAICLQRSANRIWSGFNKELRDTECHNLRMYDVFRWTVTLKARSTYGSA